MSITAFTGLHRAVECRPVTAAEIVGDNEIERLSNRFGGRKAKDTLRAGVPEGDHAAPVGGDDRIGGRAEQCVAKVVRAVHGGGLNLPDRFCKQPLSVPTITNPESPHPRLASPSQLLGDAA